MRIKRPIKSHFGHVVYTVFKHLRSYLGISVVHEAARGEVLAIPRAYSARGQFYLVLFEHLC